MKGFKTNDTPKRLANQTGLVLISLVLLCLALSLAPAQKAQSKTGEGGVLTLVLRDYTGQPIQSALCEVLSYDWGNLEGQPFTVIAKGLTDINGAVAFDVSRWPYSGYRFRFTKTKSTTPASAFFESPENASLQYRGYPGALAGGNHTQTEYFVLASNGLLYNDLSGGAGKPFYEKNPVGGLLLPRVTIMPGRSFVETAVAASAEAEAAGYPTPTVPPPAYPSPRPGEIETARSVTPQNLLTPSNSQAATPPALSTAPVAATKEASEGNATASPLAAERSQTQPVRGGEEHAGSLFSSALLAVLGLVCLVLFWKYRFKIYPWLGIEVVDRTGPNRRGSGKSSSRGLSPEKKRRASSRAPLITGIRQGKEKVPERDEEEEETTSHA
ncbi:MAG TPA: hypothetical protein VH186_09635 [Chloroflexia bacterium]|nr:hypothetical protein [Chloroflexia bacterium]